jgi:hypothetical protein
VFRTWSLPLPLPCCPFPFPAPLPPPRPFAPCPCVLASRPAPVPRRPFALLHVPRSPFAVVVRCPLPAPRVPALPVTPPAAACKCMREFSPSASCGLWVVGCVGCKSRSVLSNKEQVSCVVCRLSVVGLSGSEL